ncbi:UPF0179 family protein [Candidatus Bathyarchaeota archaeon]|nr:UPF0179 family protein [Candidatus Bathyarchaeota archaeon]
MDSKRIVTLIGSGQAKIGAVFIHKGPGSKCSECGYSKVCVHNIELGRIYEIVGVRDKTLFCKQYETEMKVVEVMNAKILSSLPSKQAIPGAIIVFKTPECGNEGCERYELCFPLGLKDGDRCEVVEVNEAFQCPLGVSRKKVFLRLAPAS